jgi:DNA-binding CsgD family transcriptional regulator
MLRHTSLDGAQHPEAVDSASFERGVRHRTLVATDRLATEDIYLQFANMSSIGDELRSMPGIPTTMIIWDDFSAVLPLDQTDVNRGAMVVRDPTVIDILNGFFDHFWTEGTPVFTENVGQPGPIGRQGRVLSLIAAGATDTAIAIARSLGVTVRTVRREVAELRAMADVRSRAEIVPAAVRRGWL